MAKYCWMGILIAMLLILAACPALADIMKLPEGVISIEEEAFQDDQRLDIVLLPGGLKTIGARAFADSSVAAVNLPDSLEFIADDAFAGASLNVIVASKGRYAYSWAVAHGYVENETLFDIRLFTRWEQAQDVPAKRADRPDPPARPVKAQESAQGEAAVLLTAKRAKSALLGSAGSLFDYSIDDEAGTVTIEKYIGSDDEVNIPASIEGRPVTEIGWEAFAQTNVKRVTIPETVTAIETMAFMECEALVSVSLPARLDYLGEWVFAGCGKLTECSVPEGVEALGGCLFYNCEKLRRVDIPSSVRAVGGWAFAGCRQLQSISLPDAVTSIGEFAFAWCERITKIALPSRLTEIMAHAFDGSGLKSIKLPKGITTINEYVFSYCTEMEEIALPSNLTAIGDYAFADCHKLKSIRLPDTVASIGESAFTWCSSLREIVLPSRVTVIAPFTFTDCHSLQSVQLSSGLTAIGEEAFCRCYVLSSLDFPARLSSIGSGALYGFTGILRFHGAAPAIAPNAFNEETKAIAIYPHGQSGWSRVIKSTYGASWLYWKADNAQADQQDTEKDKTETLRETVSNNEGKNEYYSIWERGTISSYLAQESDGSYYRVEYASGKVQIEQFNDKLQLVWKKSIAPELPVWGGYFSGKQYNFLIFGQDNEAMRDDAEVIRVVRYSKNWHRIDAVSIRDVDIKNPFDFGTVQASETDDILYLHTCRVMYNGHQADINFKIFVPTMEVIETGSVYASHSFNQYVIQDGDDIIWLNHGDAYPREIELIVEKASAGSPADGGKTNVTLMEIGGSMDDELYQKTDATIGGLESSSGYYLAAGKSIDQRRYGKSERQNIYVISVNKNDLTSGGVKTHWITAYPESDTHYVSTPQLVKISGSQFLLLWTEGPSQESGRKQVHYLFLNAQGEPTSREYVSNGKLSDCQPIVSNGSVMWYVTSNSASVFYSIDLKHPDTITQLEKGGKIIPPKYALQNVRYDGNAVTGKLLRTEGTYHAENLFVRVTFFVTGNYYMSTVGEIEPDGSFEVEGVGPIEYITVLAVGSDNGTGKNYDGKEIFLP